MEYCFQEIVIPGIRSTLILCLKDSRGISIELVMLNVFQISTGLMDLKTRLS